MPITFLYNKTPQERARIFAPGRALVAYIVKSDWRCLLTGWGLFYKLPQEILK